MIDVALLLILALVAWNVAAEGAWGAAATFLSVLLRRPGRDGLFRAAGRSFAIGLGRADWANRVDFMALVGSVHRRCFRAAVFVGEWLVPNFIAVNGRVYDVCRWGFGVMTGYVTMAFLLTATAHRSAARGIFSASPRSDR